MFNYYRIYNTLFPTGTLPQDAHLHEVSVIITIINIPFINVKNKLIMYMFPGFPSVFISLPYVAHGASHALLYSRECHTLCVK